MCSVGRSDKERVTYRFGLGVVRKMDLTFCAQRVEREVQGKDFVPVA